MYKPWLSKFSKQVCNQPSGNKANFASSPLGSVVAVLLETRKS